MIKEDKKSHIYWLGGSTCAGKTTISNRLSEKYGFYVYHCDDHIGVHINKSNAVDHPTLHRITKLSWNDILTMGQEDFLSWSINSYREEFPMILEDIEKLSVEKPILVEGVNLLPSLIRNEITNIHRGIWLVADEEFYEKHQMQRKELHERVKECKDSEQALLNYIHYDLAFGKYIVNEAKNLNLNVMLVQNDNEIMDTIEKLSTHFDLI